MRPVWLSFALALALGMLAPLATIRFGPIAMIIVAAAAIAYVGLVQLAFMAGFILPVVDPCCALVLSGAGVFAAQFAWVAAKRDAAREVARPVPPRERGRRGPGRPGRSGGDLRSLTKSTETTCLFCDLRGFSDFSEMLPEDTTSSACSTAI